MLKEQSWERKIISTKNSDGEEIKDRDKILKTTKKKFKTH